MIFKEKGYDEYLVEQIKQGVEDSKAGRVHSLDEVKQEMQSVLEEISRDFEQFDSDIVRA